ncbi:MAG TPA: ATP synthase F1 subunit delta [Pseudobdellovibrionaceae bacterium]|nr:ATP synthase F1 subunit delta [Pseudobdellovibrionaceae bacterium]
MKMQEVSKRYAKALFEATMQVNKAPVALEQIKVLSQSIFSEIEVLNFFESPMNSIETKQKIFVLLNKKLGFLEEVSQFLMILIQNGRIQNLKEIVEAFQGLFDESQGVIRGRVVSAQGLSDEAKLTLVKTISSVVNKKVIFDYETESSVIGGVIADVHGLTFDDSLQRHLIRMNDELNRRRD